MSKPRVVKDYEKLDPYVQDQLKVAFPYGFDRYLITFKNPTGKFVSALPYETEDRYYLIRMTRAEAISIAEQDNESNTDEELANGESEEYQGSEEELQSDAPVIKRPSKKASGGKAA